MVVAPPLRYLGLTVVSVKVELQRLVQSNQVLIGKVAPPQVAVAPPFRYVGLTVVSAKVESQRLVHSNLVLNGRVAPPQVVVAPPFRYLGVTVVSAKVEPQRLPIPTSIEWLGGAPAGGSCFSLPLPRFDRRKRQG